MEWLLVVFWEVLVGNKRLEWVRAETTLTVLV